MLDAVEDEADDRKAGRFNPLAASSTPRAEVRALAEGCVVAVRQGLEGAGLAGTALACRLLVHESAHAVRRAFDGTGRAGPLGCQLLPCSSCAEVQGGRFRRRRRDGDDGGGSGCCDVSFCCCCCPCDCCDCCDVCDI